MNCIYYVKSCLGMNVRVSEDSFSNFLGYLNAVDPEYYCVTRRADLEGSKINFREYFSMGDMVAQVVFLDQSN